MPVNDRMGPAYHTVQINAPILAPKAKSTRATKKSPVEPVAPGDPGFTTLAPNPLPARGEGKPTPTAPKAPRVVSDLEAVPDGTELLSFTLPGQPATKKTSQRITRWGILPSKQYLAYELHCLSHCLSAWVGQGHTPEEWLAALLRHFKDEKKLEKALPKEDSIWIHCPELVTRAPMDFGVSVCMRVYLHTWQVGDCTGYQQSVADILEKFGVYSNDSWLHWDWEGEHWFGGVDKENPRIEITIKRFRHPKEGYRANQEAEEEAKRQRAEARAAKTAAKTKTAATETTPDE